MNYGLEPKKEYIVYFKEDSKPSEMVSRYLNIEIALKKARLVEKYVNGKVWIDVRSFKSDLHSIETDEGAILSNNEPISYPMLDNMYELLANQVNCSYAWSIIKKHFSYPYINLDECICGYETHRKTHGGPKRDAIKRAAIWIAESCFNLWWPEISLEKQLKLYILADHIIRKYIQLFPERNI